MTQLLGKIIADFETSLAVKMAIGATTGTLQSATDSDGVALPTGRYFFTIDRNNSAKEYISCTLTGTALTNIKTVSRQGVETSGTVREHRVGANVIISDFAHIKKINDLLDGTTNLDASNPLEYDGTAIITSDNMLATRAYVLATATGTAVITYNQQTITATGGETIASGDILYFKEADQRWWKADADLTATIDNVQLGVAQGVVTAGNTFVVLISGLSTNFTGLTAGVKYYLSNTAGGVSTTAGTNSLLLGNAINTTTLLFNLSKTYNNPSNFVVTSAGAGDSGKGTRLNTSGKLSGTLLTAGFGGTGADGALTVTGTQNIDLGGLAVVTKNYTSISITGSGKVTFTNPHANGTLIIFKSQGDVTLTSSQTPMIDCTNTGASASNFGYGTILGNVSSSTDGSQSTTATTIGGTAGDVQYITRVANQDLFYKTNGLMMSVGTRGGAGGLGPVGNEAGGAGGTSGGAMFIECGGAWNFTTINGISVAGGNGGVGANRTTNSRGAGGGGGGGGGTFIALYNSLTSNTGTVTTTGGSGGAGGNSDGASNAQCNAGSGAGGSNIWNKGVNGTGQVNIGNANYGNGLTGGAGGAGYSYISNNTEFN